MSPTLRISKVVVVVCGVALACACNNGRMRENAQHEEPRVIQKLPALPNAQTARSWSRQLAGEDESEHALTVDEIIDLRRLVGMNHRVCVAVQTASNSEYLFESLGISDEWLMVEVASLLAKVGFEIVPEDVWRPSVADDGSWPEPLVTFRVIAIRGTDDCADRVYVVFLATVQETGKPYRPNASITGKPYVDCTTVVWNHYSWAADVSAASLRDRVWQGLREIIIEFGADYLLANQMQPEPVA